MAMTDTATKDSLEPTLVQTVGLDNVLNFVPARITPLRMVLLCFSWRVLLFIVRYSNQHSSPNAGYPEAALSGILDVCFGGSTIYHGTLVEKPSIGEMARSFSRKDFYQS